MKRTYDQLLIDYNKIVNADRGHRKQALVDMEEKSLLGVALLADKLKAKDKEIEQQV